MAIGIDCARHGHRHIVLTLSLLCVRKRVGYFSQQLDNFTFTHQEVPMQRLGRLHQNPAMAVA